MLSDDETTVWVVNLNDRLLYPVNVADGAVGQPVAIPLATGGKITCDANDVRPMAHRQPRWQALCGRDLLGESTKSAGNLAMSIYSFDPATKTFAAAPVFESKFDATHGKAGNGCGPNAGSGAWNPWTTTDVFNSKTNRQCSYPQPWLTGIAFDRGNLVLGIRDRFGDQAGEDHPVGGEGVSAGDLVRACGSLLAGWKLESNGSCGGAAGSGVDNKQGPGGGEFYSYDNFSTAHQEVSLGSIVQLPGSTTRSVSITLLTLLPAVRSTVCLSRTQRPAPTVPLTPTARTSPRSPPSRTRRVARVRTTTRSTLDSVPPTRSATGCSRTPIIPAPSRRPTERSPVSAM